MKGSIYDLPIITITIFAVAIAVLTSTLVLEEIQANTTDDQIDQTTLDKAHSALTVFDEGMVILAAVMYTATLYFSYRLRTHPIYLVPSILFLSISIWISSEVANMYNIFANVQVIQDVANSYPLIYQLQSNWPFVTAGIGILLLVVLYTRSRNVGGRTISE